MKRREEATGATVPSCGCKKISDKLPHGHSSWLGPRRWVIRLNAVLIQLNSWWLSDLMAVKAVMSWVWAYQRLWELWSVQEGHLRAVPWSKRSAILGTAFERLRTMVNVNSLVLVNVSEFLPSSSTQATIVEQLDKQKHGFMSISLLLSDHAGLDRLWTRSEVEKCICDFQSILFSDSVSITNQMIRPLTLFFKIEMWPLEPV